MSDVEGEAQAELRFLLDYTLATPVTSLLLCIFSRKQEVVYEVLTSPSLLRVLRAWSWMFGSFVSL